MLTCANEFLREEKKTCIVQGALKISGEQRQISVGVSTRVRVEGSLGPPVDFSKLKGFRASFPKAALVTLSLPILFCYLSV